MILLARLLSKARVQHFKVDVTAPRGKQEKFYSSHNLMQRVEYYCAVIREMLAMTVEVTVQGIEKGEIEVAPPQQGGSALIRLNATTTEETHLVKLLVEDGNGNAFNYTHEVHPIIGFDDSIFKAQTSLLNFAGSLQARLRHPIK